MPDPYVRTVGSVEDMDGVMCPVGVDYDTVTIGFPGCLLPYRFTAAQAEEFAHLFVSACWQAGENRRRMNEDVARSADVPIFGQTP